MIKVSTEQLRAISGICADVAQISLVSMIIPFVLPELKLIFDLTFILGVVATLVFWILSVLFVRKINNKERVNI